MDPFWHDHPPRQFHIYTVGILFLDSLLGCHFLLLYSEITYNLDYDITLTSAYSSALWFRISKIFADLLLV